MSIREKAFSGVFWTFIDTFVLKGLLFITLLYLARMLGPGAFGVFGMMSIFIGVGKTLLDSGLSASLIRDEKADHLDFSTIFIANVLISLLIYVLIFLGAPFIALFFNEEVLKDLIRVYCLVFIVVAFSSVQLTILNKDMKFRTIALVNIPSTIIGIIIGIYLANKSYGIWSIVWMYFGIESVKTILFVISSNWKPQIYFNKALFFRHYSFGYKLMLSGLLNHLFLNSYNVLIGKFFSPTILGYYDRSKQLNDYPSSTLSGIITRVAYPMMAQIKGDKLKLKNVFRKVLSFAFFLIAPLMICLAITAEPLFDLILGKEWLPAVPFFQILTLASIFFPIHTFNLNVLKVYGRSDLFLRLEIYKKGISLVVIIIAFQFGLLALVWSGVLTSLIGLYINTLYTYKVIDYKPFDQLRDLFPILIYSMLSFWAVSIGVNYFQIVGIWSLVIHSILGLIVYLLLSTLSRENPLYYAFNILRNISR